MKIKSAVSISFASQEEAEKFYALFNSIAVSRGLKALGIEKEGDEIMEKIQANYRGKCLADNGFLKTFNAAVKKSLLEENQYDADI